MAKYSKEQRRCAVELYVRYECCAADMVRELGYPSREASRCFASMFVRQVRQCFSAVWADGFPRCRHRFPVM